MSKKVTLIVPDDTLSMIIAHLSTGDYKNINMGQIAIDTEQINSDEEIDLREKIEGKELNDNSN